MGGLKLDSFLLKSFLGISDYEDRGTLGAFKFASSIDVRRKIDSIKAQQGLTDDLATGTFTSPPKFIVDSADGNSYFAVGLKIYERTSAGVYSLQYTDVAGDGNINGMGEWVNDAGDTFLYYTTNTRLNRKQLLGTGYTPGDHDDTWDDVNATVNGQTYPKTNLTTAAYHTMAEVNGALLGCNLDYLFKVGYDDSYTHQAVRLRLGHTAKTLIESGIIAKIGANETAAREKGMLYIWDTDDQNYTDKLSLPFSGINAIIETEVGIVQYGTDGMLYFFGDKAKVPIMRIPGGGQVDPDGMESDEGLALMGVYGNGAGYTGVYTYGRKKKNADFALNCEYQFNCDAIYAVAKIGSDILFTYKSGANYGVKKVDTSNKASTAKYYSLDLKAPRKLQRPVNWSMVVLQMAALPANCSVEAWRKVDKGSSWTQCNIEGGGLTYDTEGGTEATFLVGDNGKVFELQIVLNCSGNNSPEIYEAQIFFE